MMITHPRLATSLSAIMLAACGAPTPAIDLGAEREAVREAMARGTRALEQHDWNAYSTFWANDPDISVIHPANREWVDGWDAIAAKYRALIADTSAQIRATSLRQDIHLAPSGDMAWVTQQDSLYFISRGKTNAVLQWSTAVFEKRGGQWKAVHGHAAQFAATPLALPRCRQRTWKRSRGFDLHWLKRSMQGMPRSMRLSARTMFNSFTPAYRLSPEDPSFRLHNTEIFKVVRVSNLVLTPVEVYGLGDLAYEVGTQNLAIEPATPGYKGSRKYVHVFRRGADGVWRFAVLMSNDSE